MTCANCTICTSILLAYLRKEEKCVAEKYGRHTIKRTWTADVSDEDCDKVQIRYEDKKVAIITKL